MRFVDQAKRDFPVHRLCRTLRVSQSGYFVWKDHPASPRQRDDMVTLALVRSAFALSNGTCGSPRMTRELHDDGSAIGRRRTARLMRENGLRARQKRRFKRTTDSAALRKALVMRRPPEGLIKMPETGAPGLKAMGTQIIGYSVRIT